MHNDEKEVVSCVDLLLKIAIDKNASDIHLEPQSHFLRVRYRLDGVLYDQKSIDFRIMLQVISRFKVLARINIAEKRVPQDGKFNIVAHNHPIDLRVSTFPSLYGEKMVIRILNRNVQAIALEQLGFSEEMYRSFSAIIGKSNGFLLVTGPTGSGKTTTLYAALAALNSPEKNIVTLEDPVEYNVEGITQGQINSETGFTFDRGVRSLLRQDPNIMMIGEIRDKQTARVAIEAALTGHLVLSTLHTNDAPSAVMRLMDMGIEPYFINAALSGVLAQRLVRKICSHCRIEEKPDENEKQILTHLKISLPSVYRGRGCVVCGNLGYKGRTGIFELLKFSNTLRARIIHQPKFEDIYQQAVDDGMQTLMQDGLAKVKCGMITLQELMRVIS